MINWSEVGLSVGLGAIAGGVTGFGLVHLVDWHWRPRVSEVSFQKVEVNFGTLYKLCFKLNGRSQPGLCAITIKWGPESQEKTVFGKWDETPNPLEGDDLNRFRPELVPSTYYQPLFLRRPYKVPVISQNDHTYEVFSGWWFGRNKGYGPSPNVTNSDKLQLTLAGGNFSWSKVFPVSEIINKAKNPV